MVSGYHTVPIQKNPVLQRKLSLYVFDPAMDQYNMKSGQRPTSNGPQAQALLSQISGACKAYLGGRGTVLWSRLFLGEKKSPQESLLALSPFTVCELLCSAEYLSCSKLDSPSID